LDATELLSRTEKALGRQLLEKGRFGRAGIACAWVEWKSLADAGRALRDAEGLRFDWLENIAVTQLDDTLVMTLFLGQSHGSNQLVLRASAEVKSARDPVRAPAIRDIWTTAEIYERENAELFGIVFGDGVGEGTREAEAFRVRFPLRKGNA
jgi:NADH:ubiquinone oxidoreductase subunit C